MNTKISFIKYVIAQNNDLYKVTGVIDDSANKQKYYEISYTRYKFIIDNILAIVYALIISYTIFMWISIFGPALNNYYNYSYNAPYNPNFGIEATLLKVLYLSILVVTWLFIIPIVMKLIRYLFGLKWVFVKFKNVDYMDPQKEYKDYFEFYNNNIAFRGDNLLYKDSKKVERLRMEYYKQDKAYDLVELNIVRRLYHFTFLFIIPLVIFILLDIKMIFLILLLAIILLFLSHIPAIVLWKRYKRDIG